MNVALAPAAPSLSGSIVAGKYRLESLLGEGGMGSVWRAFNVQLDVPVAIKLLRNDLAATDLGERLRVEARAAAKLVHPSIVRVFDIGESESGDPFIVMELLSGESLGALLERGPLPAVQALQVLLPISEALSLAHARGVVHRDIKPDNIFIAREGSVIQPKLLDFGIAKVTSGMSAASATLTQTGTLIGSPDYMSPEQAQAAPDVDERSDIWAFCVVLYEVLAGQAPFRGDTVASVLCSVVQDEPQALETLASIDPALAAIVRRGLEKDRDARPASILELAQELACWLFAQGVLEDVTGASLEAKWLGRATEDRSAFAPPTSFAPHTQHEHATLVSVVRRSQLPSSEPLAIPLQRPRRWLAVTIGASMTALAAAWLGVTFAPVRSDALATAATLPATTVMQGRSASRAEPEPVSLAVTRADSKPEAKAEIKVPPLPKDSTTARAAQAARIPAARIPPAPIQAVRSPAAPSLPRALPAVAPSAHEKRADLMNPY